MRKDGLAIEYTVPDSDLSVEREMVRRFRYLTGIRPAALAALLLKLTAPQDRRRIVRATSGLRIYMDPFTHLGRTIADHGRYELETETVLREHLNSGQTFLDVGANEGYFSALASTLVGPTGFVLAVEPQVRLCDIVEINLRLNGLAPFLIFNNALGGEDGETGTINLWPSFNTGASSILARYRFSRAVQTFRYTSFEAILRACGRPLIDFVKVDVEGFEAHVVRKAIPHIRAGRIRHLFLDYHERVLRAHGIDPTSVHESLLAAGCRAVGPGLPELRSYVLYESTCV